MLVYGHAFSQNKNNSFASRIVPFPFSTKFSADFFITPPTASHTDYHRKPFQIHIPLFLFWKHCKVGACFYIVRSNRLNIPRGTKQQCLCPSVNHHKCHWNFGKRMNYGLYPVIWKLQSLAPHRHCNAGRHNIPRVDAQLPVRAHSMHYVAHFDKCTYNFLRIPRQLEAILHRWSIKNLGDGWTDLFATGQQIGTSLETPPLSKPLTEGLLQCLLHQRALFLKPRLMPDRLSTLAWPNIFLCIYQQQLSQ